MGSDVRYFVMKQLALQANSSRNFFETDVVFSPSEDALQKILNAYVDASKEASRHARYLVTGRSTPREAQWHEAIAQTLERVLCAFPHTTDTPELVADDDVCLPESPWSQP